MKKLICFILSAAILFSFTACGKKNTNSDSDMIDFEYYAKLGQIPECSYALGKDVDELNSELSSKFEDGSVEDFVYNVTEGEKNVLIDNGTFLYYYVKENKDKGISYIVDYGKAYGFETGTVSIEVKEALSEYKYTEEAATQDNAFFLFGVSEGTILKYKFDKYVIMFVFQENSLFATAIYDTDNWG